MTKMNLIPSSNRSIVLLLLAVVVVGAVGTATAVSITEDDVPEEAEVETQRTAEITVTDLYSESSEWTLQAESNMTGVVDWEVGKEKLGSESVNSTRYTGTSFNTTINSENNVENVTVTVSGTVPNKTDYSYEPRQNFSAVTLYRVTDGEKVEVDSVDIEYYTNNSQEAREAIESAQQAIDDAGGDSEAEDSLQSAISSYDNGNFGNAKNLASDAQEQAQQTQQSQQTTQLLMFGGVGAVLVVIVVGGIWYWRNQGDDYDKLR